MGSKSIGPQLVTTPAAQAILTASLAYATKIYVLPPSPLIANPPAKPDPKAKKRQPVIVPTKRQIETPQDYSEVLQLRPSCLDKATKRIKVARLDVYIKLEKIKSGRKNRS